MEKSLKGEDVEVPEGVSEHDIIGNYWADQHAGDIARIFQVPVGVSKNHVYYYHLTRNIQKRLIAITCNLPNRPKHIPIPREKNGLEQLNTLAMKSQHVVVKQGKVYSCALCNITYSQHDAGIRSWLAGLCNGHTAVSDAPTLIKYKNIHIGRQDIHHSHNIYFFQGIYYCNSCGCRAAVKAKYLAKKCEVAQAAGLAFLEAIRSKGALPQYAITVDFSSKEDKLRERLQKVESSTLQTLQSGADRQDKDNPALAQLAHQIAALSTPSAPVSQHYTISTPRSDENESGMNPRTQWYKLSDHGDDSDSSSSSD